MKKNTAGGLAMLGAAILGGYYLLSRSQAQTIDLGSSGLGTGGNTSHSVHLLFRELSLSALRA